MTTYKFSVGKGLQAIPKTVESDWEKLKSVMTNHKVGSKGDKYFIGGVFNGAGRKVEHLIEKTFLTLDVDHPNCDIAGVEWALEFNLDFAFIAYSTHRSTPVEPRIRIIAPLSRAISEQHYRVLSLNVADVLGLPVDPASFKPTQLMYYPSCEDINNAWSLCVDGNPIDVDQFLGETVIEFESNTGNGNGSRDLEIAIAAQPLDITDEAVDRALDIYKAYDLDYHAWVEVGIALYHQYQGSDVGLNKYLHWSSLDHRLDAQGESYYKPSDIRAKWKGFSSNRSTRTTFATVLMHANRIAGVQKIGDKLLIEDLAFEASQIETLSDYTVFVEKMLRYDLLTVTKDGRAIVASELASSFGKAKGLTKTEIKRAITPDKTSVVDHSMKDHPEWVKDWCYVEMRDLFYNMRLNYFVKPSAFNAANGRHPDVVAFEKPAALIALNDYQVPVVATSMFWPSVSELFELDGMQVVNTYKERGVVPYDGDNIDMDGQSVINVFLSHLEDLVEDPRERVIILDWMSYVIRNPGKRVNWAIVLQGDYGNGKSYLGFVFQLVLGGLASIVNGHMFAKQFSSWAHGSLVAIVEEIVIKSKDKYETLNMMKPLITNDTIQIEEKGIDAKNVPNFTSYFLLTNHKDAIPIDDGDRRYCVIYSRPWSELSDDKVNKFDRLYAESKRRADALSWFLRTRPISTDFNPKGRAPGTVAKKIMVASSRSEHYLIVQDMLDRFECEVINNQFVDVTHLKSLVNQSDAEKWIGDRNVSRILMHDFGYEFIKEHVNRVKVWSKYHYVYIKNADRDEVIKTLKEFHSPVDV